MLGYVSTLAIVETMATWLFWLSVTRLATCTARLSKDTWLRNVYGYRRSLGYVGEVAIVGDMATFVLWLANR
jgi:hypothetical protein